MLAPRSYQTVGGIASQALSTPLRSSCWRDVQTLRYPVLVPVRHATHGTAGKANGPKNGPGKRLGAKKTGDERVVTGNIIFRQRGTNWYPGENCGMGRDHTIFALEAGFVKYYRNPRLNPKRRYIGVVFDKTQTLPSPPNAARKRRLGMVAVPRLDLARRGRQDETAGVESTTTISSLSPRISGHDTDTLFDAESMTSGDNTAASVARKPSKRERREAEVEKASGRVPDSELEMRPGYMYRESNYQIGRAAERAGVEVKPFVKRNRFMAWRKRNARKVKSAEKRAMGGKKGSQRKGKKQ